MAIVKCKMCGGDLEINDTDLVIKCKHCGSYQAAPGADEAASPLQDNVKFEGSEELSELTPEEKLLIANKNLESTFAEIDFKPVALKSDGTIITVNSYYSETIDTIKTWCNLIKIVGEYGIAIGLKSDGTVVATGKNDSGQCDVNDWEDIVDIAYSETHTVGLKSDGTVVATGKNDEGQCDVSEWKDIVAIGVDIISTYGLKKDGTVISTVRDNYKYFDYCDDSDDVIAFSKPKAKLGLCKNGNVMTVFGDDYEDACLKNSIAIAYDNHRAVGLKSDGTVVAVGDNDDGQCNVFHWTDIVSVYTTGHSTYGIKSDGSVVVAGTHKEYAAELSTWKLFNDIDNYKQEQKDLLPIGSENVKKFIEEQRIAKEKEQQKREERIAKEKEKKLLQAQRREQNLCQHCGGTFKGLFTKKCSSCGKEKDY